MFEFSMDVEVTGYDEAMKQIENVMKDISQFVPDLGKECVTTGENILKHAKEICNDPECRLLRRKRIEFVDNTFFMEINYENDKARDCMIQSIKETISSMSEFLLPIFEAEIKRLEKEKSEK